MLVLSRKLGEQIMVGDAIRVQVLAIDGNKVRLGFQAPSDVRILREELCFETPEFLAPTSREPVATASPVLVRAKADR